MPVFHNFCLLAAIWPFVLFVVASKKEIKANCLSSSLKAAPLAATPPTPLLPLYNCLIVRLSVCLYVCLSVRPSVCLSVRAQSKQLTSRRDLCDLCATAKLSASCVTSCGGEGGSPNWGTAIELTLCAATTCHNLLPACLVQTSYAYANVSGAAAPNRSIHSRGARRVCRLSLSLHNDSH